MLHLDAASAESHDAAHASGTYRGRVFDEIARHRQSALRRTRLGYAIQRDLQTASLDVGHVAVIADDGTLVTTANSFDLDQRSLLLQRSGIGYTVVAGPGAFDAAAAAQGILLNPPPASNPQNIGDDGTRELALPFAFPFFGGSHTAVFINSDGNLTFGEGDIATSPRSLGRFLSDPPRIAPYFADLDPSVAGELRYLSAADRFVVTWNQVPDFASSGIGPRETFQVTLTPDGRIFFSYSGINGNEAVVGISPGSVAEPPEAFDLSGTTGDPVFAGPIVEVFTSTTALDLIAVSQRFYQAHEDAYQYLVVFTSFDFSLGGAFAFELNIQNQATGIGQLGSTLTFDFSEQFGSARLESFLNMGYLSRYPANPAQVFLRGVDSTLSILGQEAGHRFLSYVQWRDPETNSDSTRLLGRDLAHWSFFFNSDGSVVEGNRIRDNGNGTFTTIGAVDRYSELDQYIMGLRAPEEVSASFVVKNPTLPISSSAAPALNVTFGGRRVDVNVDQIIAANGPRFPTAVTAPKRHNFAFVLVIPRGSQPNSAHVAQMEGIRTGWEQFYAQATSFRGAAGTSLTRGMLLEPNPLGMLSGSEQQSRVTLLSAVPDNVNVQLTNSNPTAVAVPSQVVVPAGATSAPFPVAALNPGRASIDASAPGYETATSVIQVTSPQEPSGLALTIAGGNNQVGAPGASLPQPLRVSLGDQNRIVYPGVGISFSVIEGDASVGSPVANTDSEGSATTTIRLGAATGPVKVRASVIGTPLFADFSLTSLGAPQVPANGMVNGASFAPSFLPTVAPGSIISVFGTNLAATTASAQSLPLPTTLAGTSLRFGNLEAPLLYVSPLQINAQVPFELASFTNGNAIILNVSVRNAVSASGIGVGTFIAPAVPGVFTADSSGQGAGALTHNSTGQLVTASNPALPGEFVQIFATGLGRVSPAIASGQSAPQQPLSTTALPATVTISGVPAPVSFSGLAPGFAGLYQVNVEVPNIPPGTAQVVLTVNGVASPPVTVEIGSR